MNEASVIAAERNKKKVKAENYTRALQRQDLIQEDKPFT
jgi:hypothetical protein